MTLSVKTQKGLVFGFGVGLLLIGCLIGGLWSLIVSSIFDGEMALSATSSSFGMWEKTPIPMHIEVYLFNWSNVEDYISDPESIKPHFTEIGPYVFSEEHTKVDIQWNENNTVTFRQLRLWQFEQENSVGSLMDEITNINAIAVTVEYMIRHMNPLVQIVVDTLVNNIEPFYVTKPVGQLLFDGYEDELLNITKQLNVSEFHVPIDKFGWFYPRNGSVDYDGVFNMHTGADDIEFLGLMDAFNYEQHPSYFDGDCGRIRGSTGELFPPIEGEDTLDLFAPEICSSITLARDGSYSRLGIEGYRFIGNDHSFDNGSKYPNNRCYCAKNEFFGIASSEITASTEECLPSGVRGISKCRFGAPAFVSFPHFYKGDPSYVNNVDGLNPDKNLHEFYIAIEPITGIPLDVKARMQLNILLRPYKNSKLFSNVTQIMIPALWFTQTAQLTNDLGDLTKLLINLPAIGMGTFFGLAGIGALLIVAGIVITLQKGWKGDEGDKLLTNGDSFSSAEPNRERE